MPSRRQFLSGLAASLFQVDLRQMHGPILSPDQPFEGNCAMPFSGGVFRLEREWRCYYLADFNKVCLAFSDDGLRWSKPDLGLVAGTNILLTIRDMDSFSVLRDRFAWRMCVSTRSGGPLRLLSSRNGLWWTQDAVMAWAGDRTTIWLHPDGRYVFNVRAGAGTGGDPRRIDRVVSDVWPPKAWEPQRWLTADDADGPGDGGAAQLYALDVVPDGPRLVGLFTIWRGQEVNRPKLNDVCLGFSTDGGETWQRSYTPVLTRSETPGAWNYGNVQGCSGGLVRLSPWHVRLYASGRAGDGTGGNGVCSMGCREIVLV